MEKVLISDLYNYEIIHSLKNVGQTLIFTKTTMDQKENCYHHNLYTYNILPVQLTSSNKVGSFIKENEDTILFMDVRSKEDKGDKSVYYRLSLKGGEALRAFEIPYIIISAKIINHYLVGIIEENLNENKDEDYVILHEVPFVENGAGFIDSYRHGIMIYDLDTNETKRITPERFDANQIEVDDHQIYYTGKIWEDIHDSKDELYVYDILTKQTKKLLNDEYMIRAIAKKDDHLILSMSDMKEYDTDQYCAFYDYDLQRNQCKLICKYDYPISNAVGSDVGSRSNQIFTMIDDHITFLSTHGYRTGIYEIDLTGVKPFLNLDLTICSYTKLNDEIYLIGMESGKLPELYSYHDQLKQLTYYSDVFNDKYIGQVIYTPFINRKQMKIDGWIIYPKDFDPTKTYPAILDIHGGPRGAYGDVFFHEMQVWASAGYFVFFCNPQGSDGYGQEFGDMRGQYGTKDYDDLMDFTDHILDQYVHIDPNRLGVTGGSYGGYMTNWIITHTTRFKVAATQRSISNWISDYGTSGISYLDGLHLGARPWDDISEMWRSSPIRFASNCQTPTLFIHSFEDYTCAISQAYELFTAFKMLGIKTKAVLFKGENHSLSRTGKPKHRQKRLEEITNWMNEHIGEKI